ncbi:MAG TPA: hypothetical protein VGF48_23585 [Thermoanaerobaculia bacterium]
MPLLCQTLRTIQQELDQLRRNGPTTASELEAIAIRLGRQRHPAAKEPTWFSTLLPDLPPLSIPGHERDLMTATATCIFDQFDDDIIRLNEICEEDQE